MSTGMMVDDFDVNVEALADEVLDHWVRCGSKPTRVLRKEAERTVRYAVSGVRAQGLKLVPGTQGTDAINLVLLARYILNCRAEGVTPATLAAEFGAARTDAYVITRALACQDVAVVPA